MGLVMLKTMRCLNSPKPGRGRLEEGETSEVMIENGRNLPASTPNAMVLDSRVSDGRTYDEEGSRTWSSGFGWAGGGG